MCNGISETNGNIYTANYKNTNAGQNVSDGYSDESIMTTAGYNNADKVKTSGIDEPEEDKSILEKAFDFVSNVFNPKTERYFPLDNQIRNAKNQDKKFKLMEISRIQNDTAELMRTGDNIDMIINMKHTSDSKGIRLGDLKELFGIDDGVIVKQNDLSGRYAIGNDYTNLDDIIVCNGSRLRLNVNDLGVPDMYDYNYRTYEVGKM